jgi:hypothetical protein
MLLPKASLSRPEGIPTGEAFQDKILNRNIQDKILNRNIQDKILNRNISGQVHIGATHKHTNH